MGVVEVGLSEGMVVGTEEVVVVVDHLVIPEEAVDASMLEEVAVVVVGTVQIGVVVVLQ